MKRFSLTTITLATLLALTTILGACSWKDVHVSKSFAQMLGIGENDKMESQEEFTIQRYDLYEYRYLTTGDLSALQDMQEDHPTETRLLIEGILKIGTINQPHIYKKFYNYYQDRTLQQVLADVNAEFGDMSKEKEELSSALSRLQELMPDTKMPVVYTQIGDFGESITINGNSIGISLDKYLGSDYPLYARFFDANQRKDMNRANIVPDCLVFYLLSLHPLKNFETSTQEQRDSHMQCILAIVNSVLDKPFFEDVKMSRGEALDKIKN